MKKTEELEKTSCELIAFARKRFDISEFIVLQSFVNILQSN